MRTTRSTVNPVRWKKKKCKLYLKMVVILTERKYKREPKAKERGVRMASIKVITENRQ